MKRIISRDPLTGVTTYFHKDPVTGNVTFQDVQDVTDIVELNKFKQNHGNNGKSPSGEMWHAATVPLVILVQWAREAGVDMASKEFGEVVKRKLNDPDNRAFRTGVFRI